MKPQVTVIVPAFRAAGTLRDAIASARAQTLSAIEIVIVDDGSPDETGALADALVREDPRIRVRHQRNAGGYLARLKATRAATTPWLAFLDADDTYEPTALSELHDFAQINALDVAEFDIDPLPKQPNELFLNREDALRDYIRPIILEGQSISSMCDKLYRNTFALNTFVELSIQMFDDLSFNFQYFTSVNRVGRLHHNLYHYNINAGSSVRNYREKSFLDFMRVDALRREMAPRYGLSPDDVVFDAWVIKNARNHLVLASLAPAPSWGERLENVLRIIRNDRIRAAAKRVRPAPELRLAFRFPRLTILLLRLAKRLRRRG